MNGGILNGGMTATEPQDEPTPTIETDESTPTPTPEPTQEPTQTPTPEPTPEHFGENNNIIEESQETDNADNKQGDNEISVPHLQDSSPVSYADYVPCDYSEQITAIQETIVTLTGQEEQVLVIERTNGMLLTFLLAALLCDIFWKRVLR